MNFRIAIDTGGTFTDLVVLDDASGKIQTVKVPSTPDNQAVGVMEAVTAAGADCSELSLLIHGTTTTTTALLEKKIARCGLITRTSGRLCTRWSALGLS